MKKLLKRGLVAVATLASLLLAIGYVRYYDIIHVAPVSFAETQAVVLPHVQVFLPGVDAVRPAVLLFHGCGGVRPSLQRRAREFVEEGYVAIIVDSLTGRGIDWQRVCSGLEMFGDQRAAEDLVGLEYARQHPQVDSDRLFIVGYSHGGWAVLEGLASNGTLPRGLSDSPAEPLAGLRAAITWYPYCGIATRFSAGWESPIPVLMLLAAKDQITPHEPSTEVARRQMQAGQPVEWTVFACVGHGFDTGAEWVALSDEGVHRDALARQSAFLSRYDD